MTPRLTSSSRKLRTTAIATLVAVSTAVTGVTPAFAADAAGKTTATNTVNSNAKPNATQPAGLNINDGSKLPEGKATTETKLQTATNKVAETLTNTYGVEKGDTELSQILAKFQDVFANFMNPSALTDNEQGALNALRARFEDITGTLKTAAQNQANAQASVDAALAADAAARTAFANITVDASSVGGINEAIKAVNDKNTTGLDNIPLIATPVTADNVFDVIAGINAHKALILKLDADKDETHFVNRDYAKALRALLANEEVVEQLLAPYNAAQDALIASQETDVIPMMMFLSRSRAQVQVLRILQAEYGTAVRMIELYENDTLDRTKTLSVKDAYYNALGLGTTGANSITAAWNREFAQLLKADEQAKTFFQGYKADKANSADLKKDDEQKAYERFRKDEAVQTYQNIVADRVWQNELEKAQNKDRDYFNALTEQTAAEKAKSDAAAARAEADRLSKAVADNAAANKALNDKLAEAEKNADEKVAAAKKTADEKVAAAKKAAADAEKKREEAEKQAAIEKAKREQAEKNNKVDKDGDKDGDKNDKDGDKDGDNKFPIMPVAIAGIVIAIIAALAAQFPVLLAALPKI